MNHNIEELNLEMMERVSGGKLTNEQKDHLLQFIENLKAIGASLQEAIDCFRVYPHEQDKQESIQFLKEHW